MSKTVVTLSGDDAELFRAFQRIIDQQTRVDAGYKKTAAASREAAAAAKQAAKEAADAERDRQRQIDNVTGKVASMAASYVSVQSAIALVTTAHNEMIARQSEALDMAKQIAAAQQEAAKNMAGQSPAQIDEALSRQIPAIAKETGFGDLPKLTTALGSAASIVGPEAAPGVVRAAAQVTRFTPEELQRTTTATADLMAATGLKDAERALALLASTGSVARPEQLSKLATGAAVAANAAVTSAPNQDPVAAASEAIAVYAKLSKVDPEGQSAATATVQLIKQVSDLFTDTKQIRERDAKIATLQEQQPENRVAVQRAQMKVEETQTRAAAFPATDRSATAQDARLDLEQAQLALAAASRKAAEDAKELAKLTATRAAITGVPQAQREQLEKRIAAAEARAPMLEQIAKTGDFANMPADVMKPLKAAADEQKIALTPMGAKMAAGFAKANDARDIAAAREQLARMQTAPQTFETRLERIRQSPELRTQINETLTGEAKFQPLMRELLDGGSRFAGEVREARAAINTRPESFRDVAGTTVQTAQAQIAAAGNRFEAARNVAQTFDTESQIRASIGDIASQAMATTDRGMANFIQSSLATAQRGVDSMGTTTPVFARNTETQLLMRLEGMQQRGAEPNQIEVVAAALKSIAELAARPEAMRGESPAAIEKYLAEQSKMQAEANRILAAIRDGATGGNKPPNPAGVRAAATKPTVESAN